MQDTDTGSNSGSHVQPNMDAVAEVQVLTSNYQAEYGRNSSGTINFTVKSGTRDFHGSGFWFFRHEMLNANSFFNNRSGTAKPIQRINNFGYTIGGPIYAKGFNRNKDKLFFFFSQEYVRRQNYPGVRFATTPTALERAGDFSQTFDVNGALIPIKDPNTGQPFPGNVIPKARFNSTGLAILNFLPLPNYEAERFCARALAIAEKAYGGEHPATANAMGHLGRVRCASGDTGRAVESLLRRALSVNEQALGPDYPATASALSDLAELFKARSDFAAAGPLYVRALAIQEKAFGPDDPHAGAALNDLGALYSLEGDDTRAEPLYRRALAIYDKALTPDHRDGGAGSE